MPDAAALRYLELLKKSLLDELYIENEARLIYLLLAHVAGAQVDESVLRDIDKHQPAILNRLRNVREIGGCAFDWTINQPDGKALHVNLRNVTEFEHTMIGRQRLDNIHQLLDRVVADNVGGDLIETGVWRGGATIFMRGYLAAHGVTDRRVWVADSFQGLPEPSLPQDAQSNFSAAVFPILSVSQAQVEELFARYDLLDDQVKFLPGWFKDTLPAVPIERLALMRLDGDLYESTRDALVNLYSRLSPGGFCIIDDYNDFSQCRLAVDEFRASIGETAPIEPIDWTGVYWRKVF